MAQLIAKFGSSFQIIVATAIAAEVSDVPWRVLSPVGMAAKDLRVVSLRYRQFEVGGVRARSQVKTRICRRSRTRIGDITLRVA